MVRKFIASCYKSATHLFGIKNSYFEDYMRVYPDAAYNKLGLKYSSFSDIHKKNFINHQKFYKFSSQFVSGKCVADIGCGSGYGCEILKKGGASCVFGSDISEHAIDYAEKHFKGLAEFKKQNILNLSYEDNKFDLITCSEVIEHVKEYNKEQALISELKRVTKPGGLIIIGTPNTEMMDDHGFSFEEIDALSKGNFTEYILFENLLEPFDEDSKRIYLERISNGMVGILSSSEIDLQETVSPDGSVPKRKSLKSAREISLGRYRIDTSLLHNTHSWMIIAVKE